eukprot:PhF_6_TR21670/c0_g1_i1/m.30924/K06874/K06874; zinc finger protein
MSEDNEPVRLNEGEVTVIESMCPKCQENGDTRLLFTSIPHFRQVIISSFECHNEDCGYSNREVQFSGEFPSHGVRYDLKVVDRADLNRQVVKSEHAIIKIPELDLEIPSNTQSGTINTVEGILNQCVDSLESLQPQRRVETPEVAAQIDAFLSRVRGCMRLETLFHFQLEDPSGNSNIEALPSGDKHLTMKKFMRTNEQREAIGLAQEITDKKVEGYNDGRTEEEEKRVEAGELDEIMYLDEDCPSCHTPGRCKMHRCEIPFFKETIIMAFTCDNCGYRNSEVRSGGGVPPQGKRITLKVLTDRDLVRDVLKSETCNLIIPEIDLELGHGTLGGMFTTVEGLLSQVLEHLKSTAQTQFHVGDSAVPEEKTKWSDFLKKLEDFKTGATLPFTLIFDDPMANIYVQNPKAHLLPPENVDPQLNVESYERTEEQNEEFGLLDMKTENYTS